MASPAWDALMRRVAEIEARVSAGSRSSHYGAASRRADQTQDDAVARVLREKVRCVITGAGIGGDMFQGTYDPTLVVGDIFDMDSMVEGTAKILTIAERAAIIANTAKVTNATHSGEVTGATVLTVDPTAVSNKALVTAVGADHLLIVDDTDGALKKSLVSDIAAPAASTTVSGTVEIATQVEVDAGVDTTRSLTPETLAGSALSAAVTANTLKVTNANHTGEVTGSGALTVGPTAVSNKSLVTAVGADHVLIVDDTDGALKKSLISDFANANHTGDVTGATALTIADEAVTLAKMQHIATASFLGRNTAATGDVEVLTIPEAQGMLGITTQPIKTVTTNYTLTASDHTLLVDSTAGNVTITVPAGVAETEYIIKKNVSQNEVFVVFTGAEFSDYGTTLYLVELYHTVYIKFLTPTWRLLLETIWAAEPPLEHTFMQSDDATSGPHSSSLYYSYGLSSLTGGHGTKERVQSVAPSSGRIHSLYVELAGTAIGAGDSWVFTLYKNGIATALTVTIGEAATSGSDLATRIAVVAGDVIQWFIEETGVLSHNFNLSSVYEAANQPMFGHYGLAVSANTYSPVNTPGNSTTEDQATIFPIAGTIRNFYFDDSGMDAAGDEVTYYLQSWDGSVWATELTFVHNYTADGLRAKSDLVQTLAVAAGDVLRWKVTETGTGPVQYASVGCEFVPTTAGDKFIAGSLDQLGSTAAYSGPMGSNDDFTTNAQIGSNLQVPANGTASTLYIACNAAPGATAKYIEATLTKDGTDQSLTARITDPALSANDTVNTSSFTKGTNDMGVHVATSASIAAQEWVAWGFKYRS